MGWPRIRAGLKSEEGQATIEWVGLIGLVALALVAMVAAGVRVPGAPLAEAVASRLVCAVSLSDGCGEGTEDGLILAYGPELAAIVRENAPTMLYERGMHALPVDYRRCRSTACGDGAGEGSVRRSDTGEPVTLFVHVIDCRPEAAAEMEASGGDCAGDRAGRLYVQFWEYYADSATYRGIPIAGKAGYHLNDWEGSQFRINADGSVDERASSHNGYNHDQGIANWGSDAGFGPLNAAAEAIGARPRGGWGDASGYVFVSGGSHAGNVEANLLHVGSATPGHGIRLVPLEPIAAAGAAPGFGSITPPWVKEVWSDPEAEGTG